jgi:hypothetical protein
MRVMIKCSAIILALAVVTPANAKGCLKGALIGGVAGHYTVHHGLLGAAAGCIIGRHEAKSALRWSEKGQSIRRRAMAKIASS